MDYVNKTTQEGFENNNSKPFWRYIKSKRQDNIGTAPLKRKGSLFSDSKDKAQILVEQFRSVFTKIGTCVLPVLPRIFKHELTELDIKTPGVEKLLQKINTSKAIGPDNISNMILKNCAKQLAPELSAILQSSVNSGELPPDCVNANISTVFKKGDVHLAENYGPVSLTSVCCKLLEHIICKHLLNHLERSSILTLSHGFRSGFSCQTQLLITLNDFFTLP